MSLPLSTDMTDSSGNNSFAGLADLVRGRIPGSKWTGGDLMSQPHFIRPGPPQGLLIPELLHLNVGPALDVTELTITAGTVCGCCSRDMSREKSSQGQCQEVFSLPKSYTYF